MEEVNVPPIKILCSEKSIESAYVSFHNKTSRYVNVYWIDYKGTHIKYLNLRPDEKNIVNTYSKHPWIFKDAITGERMFVNRKFVFWPQPSYIMIDDQLRPVRRQVHIHLPMRSLLETSTWEIIKNVNQISDIELLGLPKILQNTLRALFIQKLRDN